MTVLAICAACAAAFLFGFLLGTLGKQSEKPTVKSFSADSEELEKLRREYSNFLSYDGTEQSQK